MKFLTGRLLSPNKLASIKLIIAIFVAVLFPFCFMLAISNPTHALTVTTSPTAGTLSFDLTPGIFNKVSQTITVDNTNYHSGYTMTLETAGYEYLNPNTPGSQAPQLIFVHTNDLVNTTSPTDTTKRIPTLSSTITSPDNFHNNWGYSFFNTNIAVDDPLRNTFYPIPEYNTNNTLVTTNSSSSAPDEYELSFGAKVDTSVSAGSYQNNVVVRVVSNPTTCSSLNICYDENYPADSTTGSPTNMGNQTISSTDTEATLWASNYQRSGYGFAGWNTAPDGTGTSYGPNQTITDSTVIDEIKNSGLILYAIWKKSAGDLQSWTPASCNAMNIGDTTALTDTRDGNTYAIAKLADGKCWMIENLRLSNTHTTTGQAVTINSADTNNPASGFALNASQDPTSSPWCTTSDAACIDQSLHATNNTEDTVPTMAGPNSNVYSYGNYYNWYTATAGNGTYSMTSGNTAGDICPAGWHLPTGSTTGEYKALNDALGGDTGTNGSRALRSFPNNFVYSGLVNGSSLNTRSIFGSYWSSTADSSSLAYALAFNSSGVDPDTNGYGKYGGFSVRCMFSTTYTINYDSNGGSGTMNPQTATAGQATNLSANTFTRDNFIFNGWNTDPNGNGTSYTDEQQVTDLASAGGSITLYAQWIKPLSLAYAEAGKTQLNGYYKLQDLNSNICDAADVIGEGSQMQAIDTRDNKIYWITKLADGKCWFTQNLDHDIDAAKTYTPQDTDISTNWTPDKSTYQTGDTTWGTFSAGDYIQQSYDPGNKIWDETQNSNNINFDNMTQGTNTHYHIGNYYNLGAAVAMNDTSILTGGLQDLDQSICPTGWTLPKSGNNDGPGSFEYLSTQYKITNSIAHMRSWEAPLYFTNSGEWEGYSIYLTSAGHFASSTIYTYRQDWRILWVRNGAAIPNASGDHSYSLGYSIRCVSR